MNECYALLSTGLLVRFQSLIVSLSLRCPAILSVIIWSHILSCVFSAHFHFLYKIGHYHCTWIHEFSSQSYENFKRYFKCL